MNVIKDNIKDTGIYFLKFIKWIVIALITGIAGGLIGSAFHHSVEIVTEIRMENPKIIFLLPIAGLVIVFLYKLFRLRENIGTNDVFNAVRKKGDTVPPALAPAIFLTTVLTHMFGGSAGREGAALQLGGSISSVVGKMCRVDRREFPIVLMCGMAAVFSALFTTPLTATIFAMEVVSVGVIYYSALLPCIVAAVTGYKIALILGATPLFYEIAVPEITAVSCVQIAGLSVLCAILSIIFCTAMHKTSHFAKHYIKNSYLRIVAGAAVIVLLTLILGTQDYNGAGMDVVARAIEGSANPEAFLMKIVFTAITIGVGFRGGEIVPTFFIGATFGCVFGGLLGLNPGFGAAIGLVALFCGVVNCPIASIFLSFELFGGEGIIFFAIACAISYLLSGYHGLYSSQKIMYSKLCDDFIDIYAK